MSIFPLPQFETDLKEHLDAEDAATYARLKAPTSLVVRFGAMKLVGEFPYDGQAKPGCGSKLVVRTHRGTELGEMLTSTCPNSGCSKSVSRQEMLQYIENSGGRDYPFFTQGKVLRIATKEDLDAQAKIEQSKHELKMEARRLAEARKSIAKVVDAEPILGNERLTFYYYAEERLDLHHLIDDLQRLHPETRVEMKLVGARDEARLTADYEKCGQHCCCKNFLKVLKPVSMKSAKVQKATLDPLKISGRCGRLMCCLRYEDQTYEELSKRLPRKKSRVGTPEGDGIVVDTQILTQLALVLLDNSDKRVAIAIEDLTPPESATAPPPPAMPPPSGPGHRPMRDGRQPDRAGDRGIDRSADRTRRDAGSPARGADPRRSERSPERDRATDRGPKREPDRGPDRGPVRGREPIGPRAEQTGDDPSIVDFDDIETDMGDAASTKDRSGVSGPNDRGPSDRGPVELGPDGQPRRKKRRRRRRGGGGGSGPDGAGGPQGSPGDGGGAPRPDRAPGDRPPRPQSGPGNEAAREGQAQGQDAGEGQGDGQRRKRRRRRRRGGGSGGGSGPDGGAGGGEGGGGGGGQGGGA